jgi:hypothetical protein
VLISILSAAILVGTSWWVYRDAQAFTKRSRPVYFSIGAVEVSTPTAWAFGCLCLWILFTPLYLTCRRNS